MTGAAPQFSPFPFDRLRRLTRREAAIESSLARWIAAVAPSSGPARPHAKLAALIGNPVRARLLGVVADDGLDPNAAVAELRHAGASIVVRGAARPVRVLAQRLLGGTVDLEAPRPLTVTEQAIWAVAVAAAVADLGLAAEVWPLATGAAGAADALTVAFAVELPPAYGAAPMTVTARCAPGLLLRAPPPRPPRTWRFDLPIIVGRCALPRAALAALAARDVITVERCCELVIGEGALGLSAAPGAVEARVATEYGARDMALPDDATLELTVQLGTTRLSLRQLGELAIGQIVALGRPLAGPYDVRAAGRLVGQGELVDIDGELGVRIVSLTEAPEPP